MTDIKDGPLLWVERRRLAVAEESCRKVKKYERSTRKRTAAEWQEGREAEECCKRRRRGVAERAEGNPPP